MKWHNPENITFNRGNYDRVIFKFDNSKVWLIPDCIMTTQSLKCEIRKLGKMFNSKEVTIKHLFKEEDNKYVATEHRDNVIDFYIYQDICTFRTELPCVEGEKIQYKVYAKEDVFAI